MENEIITLEDKQVVMFLQLLNDASEKLRRALCNRKPVLGGEIYLTNRELSKILHLTPRSLQEYRDKGLLPYIKLEGKILYRDSDIRKLLDKHYYRPWADNSGGVPARSSGKL